MLYQILLCIKGIKLEGNMRDYSKTSSKKGVIETESYMDEDKALENIAAYQILMTPLTREEEKSMESLYLNKFSEYDSML